MKFSDAVNSSSLRGNMFYIGIVLEKEHFKAAILKKRKGVVSVEAFQSFPLGPDSVKLFYNLPLFHTGKQAQIISGLKGEAVFIRKLHLPLGEKRKVFAALPFQLETLIPFPQEETLVCTLLKQKNKKMTVALVVATTKERLLSHSSALAEKEIQVDQVSCEPTALMRFANWQFSEEERLLVFHAREDHIQCIVIESKELVLAQTVQVNSLQEAALEIDKLSLFLKQKGAIEENTPWLLTGDIRFETAIKSVFPGAQRQLSEANLREYALAIGLALDGTHLDGNSVQFCQNAFTPEHILLSRKKKLTFYLGTCLAVLLFAIAGGSILIGKKQRALTTQLHNYLPSSIKKSPLNTVEEIEDKLHEWELSLNKRKIPFALVPTVPKVSDVLAWISAHPAFLTEEGGKKEGMEIKSLHYSLSKYPKIGDPSAPYAAQVELEFTAASPRAARDFHEALLKGDHVVDAKKEIKWAAQNQTYRVSFELNKEHPR